MADSLVSWNSNYRLKGHLEMTQKLERLARMFPREVAEAMREEMEIEKEESQAKTPLKTGRLRASHVVRDPYIGPRVVRCQIEVTAPYAVPVHENLGAFFRVGQAKFLESTLRSSRRSMGVRIANRIGFDRPLWARFR